MRSLITGIGGFAGQHLASWLLSRDEAVRGVARGEIAWHVGDVAGSERFRAVQADLIDREAVTHAVEAAAPDRVHHLAARSSVGASFADPIGTLANNTSCLVNV